MLEYSSTPLVELWYYDHGACLTGCSVAMDVVDAVGPVVHGHNETESTDPCELLDLVAVLRDQRKNASPRSYGSGGGVLFHAPSESSDALSLATQARGTHRQAGKAADSRNGAAAAVRRHRDRRVGADVEALVVDREGPLAC